MLVLSRKVGERILIGDQITVTVVRISGGGVRLGIEAPPEMAVIREELQDNLDKQGRTPRISIQVAWSRYRVSAISAAAGWFSRRQPMFRQRDGGR